MKLYDINLYKIANNTRPLSGEIRSEAEQEPVPVVLLMRVSKHIEGELQYAGRIQTLAGQPVVPGDYTLRLQDNLQGRISVQQVLDSHGVEVSEYLGHDDLWTAN
jgi:hypothetical protein